MPSTVSGLLVLLGCLAPGFIYVLLAERSERPERKFSVFRETSQVVLASVFASTVALSLFALACAWFPDWTPEVGRLIRARDEYWESDYQQLLSWGIGLFLLACATAYLWGAYSLGSQFETALVKVRLGKLILPPAKVQYVSAWWKLFKDDDPEAHIRVRCRLADGTEITGWLESFNHAADEVADRELTLDGPLIFINTDGSKRVNECGRASVSARTIQLLEVNFCDSREPTNVAILDGAYLA